MNKTPYPTPATWRLVFDATGGPAIHRAGALMWDTPGQELRLTADGQDWEVGYPTRTQAAWRSNAAR